MTKDELVKLAERCEAASGPDRELDAEIDWVISGIAGRHAQPNFYGNAVGYWRECSNGPLRLAPTYTSSLDAAMMLVPEGKVWSVNFDPRLSRGFVSAQDGYGQIHTLADTPALALCAAALRACATTTGEPK